VAESRQADWTAVRVHRDTAAALARLRDEWVEADQVSAHPRDARERTGLDRVIRRLIAEVFRHREAARAQRARQKEDRRVRHEQVGE
jgi:hypothetical protein